MMAMTTATSNAFLFTRTSRRLSAPEERRGGELVAFHGREGITVR